MSGLSSTSHNKRLSEYGNAVTHRCACGAGLAWRQRRSRAAVGGDFGIARTTVSEIVTGKRRQYDAPLRPALEQVS